MRSLVIFFLMFPSFLGAQQPVKSAVPDFKQKPQLKWKFKVGKAVLGSPVIDGERVFFGGLDSTFYCLDVRTAKVIWKMRTAGEIRSTPLIAGEVIYLNGGDGILYALDKNDGKERWRYKTNGEKKYDFADYHQSSPVLYSNTLYFGSGDGRIYAINQNGVKRWDYQTGDVVHGTPAIADDRIFVGSFDGYVYSLDADSGSLLWKFKTVGHRFFPKGEVQGSPVATTGIVIVGARDYNVYAIDAKSGFAHWNKAFPRGWVLTQTLHDSVVHMAGADERVLIAADPVTGREFWKTTMEFLVFGRNAYSENMMYTGTTIGKLHGIDARTGKKIWTFETDGYVRNRLRYFKEDDSYRDDIFSIIKSNEHFLEVEYELGGIFSAPAITAEVIIFTSTEGTVYCLER